MLKQLASSLVLLCDFVQVDWRYMYVRVFQTSCSSHSENRLVAQTAALFSNCTSAVVPKHNKTAVVTSVPVSSSSLCVQATRIEWMVDLVDTISVLESLLQHDNSDVLLLEEMECSDTEGKGDDESISKDIDAEDPQQQRLRRHRESMARLRLGQRKTIKLLEQQEQALQQKLHRRLAWMDHHRTVHKVSQCQRLVYADSVRAAESHMLHQYALEDALGHWQTFVRLLTNEISQLDKFPSQTSVSSTGIGPTQATDGFWVRLQDAEAPFYCERVLPETCASAITKALEMIASTRRRLATTVVTDVCVGDCLGWKTEWHIDDASAESDLGPMLHFRYTRITRLRTSLDDLLDKTWAILQSQDQCARLYGSTVVAKHVQKISDDAFIEVRNLPVRENHCLLRYFNLVSRMRAVDEDSVAIVTLALNKQPRLPQLEARHCTDEVNGIVWIRHNTAALQLLGCSPFL